MAVVADILGTGAVPAVAAECGSVDVAAVLDTDTR